jgi:hypothetical protein
MEMSDLKNVNMDEGLLPQQNEESQNGYQPVNNVNLLENEEMNALPMDDDPKPEIDNQF